MVEPVKVLFIIDNLGTGGAQEFVYQLCRHLVAERVDLSVCTLHSGGVYQAQIEGLGIPVHVLSPNRSVAKLPLLVINLFRLLRTQRYDVAHTFLQASFALATPCAHWLHIPTVHTIVAVREQVQSWYFPLMAWYQRWVAMYITPIPAELTEVGIQAQKIKLVEVTTDVSEMLDVKHDDHATIAPFDLTDAYPVVLSVGRLHPHKGHAYAINAWSHVLRAYPRARLLIVGNGDNERRLRDLANELGVYDAVIFAGFRKDLANLFTRADILLRTSINEGVNLTTIQGMAAGLPVIGFNNSAPKEIISHGVNGYLVALGDEFALAQTINELSCDAAQMRAFRQAGQFGVHSYYSISRVLSFYNDLYDAIKQKRSLAMVLDMSSTMHTFSDHFSRNTQAAS